MPPLRLTVDARVAAEDTRGIGRYARAILRRLVLRDDVALTLLSDGLFLRGRRAAYARALGSDNFAIARTVRSDAAVVWHPANGTFFPSHARSVVTIHDAVPFRYPDPDGKRRDHAQRPFLRSAQSASRVIAVSNFGRAELAEVFGLPLERIDVIHHGVEPAFSPGAAEPLPPALAERPFLLFVGDPIGEPRKNFPLLYEAYRRAWPQFDGPLLVVAGPRAPQLPGVVHAGNLDDDVAAASSDRLRALYRGALALALASYHETFGMPLLEAMACATPVLAANAGSLPEIGGDAALYLNPHDAQAWAAALRRVVDDLALRATLREAGLERVKSFSWDESARRHLALFATLAP
ncbi:MAG TPA: glycosyltransferase family 1 protein [Candidatus Cybelea sp.]|jgi:glycosyltransferase involved in cell wall biosynthesis|nr:glycosyltransferase family 1 protein [Candidatus Cybelea sp.]